MTAVPRERRESLGALADADVTTHPFSTTALQRDTLTGRRRAVRMTMPSTTGRSMSVLLEGEPPKWFEPVVRSISELLQLRPNWNSYGAAPIALWAPQAVLDLLFETASASTPPPQVVPTNRGSIQLEWHLPDVDLEVKVLSPTRFAVSFEDFRTGSEWEGELTSDLSRLTDYLADITSLKRRVAVG